MSSVHNDYLPLAEAMQQRATDLAASSGSAAKGVALSPAKYNRFEATDKKFRNLNILINYIASAAPM